MMIPRNNGYSFVRQAMLNFLRIRNANCVIHYDFPTTKQVLAERLWTMNNNFKLNIKPSAKFLSKANDAAAGDAAGDIAKEWLELESHIFLTENDKNFAEGLLSFLTRIGIEQSTLPSLLVNMAAEKKKLKDEKRMLRPMCPYVKSFGQCMTPLPNSCEYRHLVDLNTDKFRRLSAIDDTNELLLPKEGHVKVIKWRYSTKKYLIFWKFQFKIVHVKETNHFFAHLLTNYIEQEDGTFENTHYDLFKHMDMEMQLYFSDHENRRSLSMINKKKLYAHMDTETTIFKRFHF